jgi:purine-binding chemotaxis protein CheW
VPATNSQKLMCGMSSLPDGGTMLELDSAALLES